MDMGYAAFMSNEHGPARAPASPLDRNQHVAEHHLPPILSAGAGSQAGDGHAPQPNALRNALVFGAAVVGVAALLPGFGMLISFALLVWGTIAAIRQSVSPLGLFFPQARRRRGLALGSALFAILPLVLSLGMQGRRMDERRGQVAAEQTIQTHQQAAATSPWLGSNICDALPSLPVRRPYHESPGQPGLYLCTTDYYPIPGFEKLEHHVMFAAQGPHVSEAEKATISLSLCPSQQTDGALSYLAAQCDRLLSAVATADHRPPTSELQKAARKVGRKEWPLAAGVAFVEREPLAKGATLTTVRCGIERKP